MAEINLLINRWAKDEKPKSSCRSKTGKPKKETSEERSKFGLNSSSIQVRFKFDQLDDWLDEAADALDLA